MARKREIHPGFFKNEDIAEMDYPARLLFIGMWSLADREGRLQDRPKKLRGEILPYDNCDGEELVATIAAKGFIIRYEVDGNKYIQINNWLKYQDIHPREAVSIIPPVPTENQGTTLGEPKADLEQVQDSPVNPIPSYTSIPSLGVVTARESEAALREVMTAIQQVRPVTKNTERDLIADIVAHYPRDWILRAIQVAVEREARTFSYVDGILANWRKAGFTDTDRPWEDVKKNEQRRPNGRDRPSKTGPGTKPSQVDWENEPDQF